MREMPLAGRNSWVADVLRGAGGEGDAVQGMAEVDRCEGSATKAGTYVNLRAATMPCKVQ